MAWHPLHEPQKRDHDPRKVTIGRRMYRHGGYRKMNWESRDEVVQSKKN